MKTGSNDKKFSPSVQLAAVFYVGSMDAFVNYVEKAKPIANAVLKDRELLDHIDNDEMKTFKQKLKTFKKGYRNCKDLIQFFKLFELFSSIGEELYDQEEDKKLTPQGKIILKLLRRYNLDQIEKEFKDDFNKLITNFEKKYAEVKDDLKMDTKDGIGDKIIKWHEHFSTLKDYDDQNESFSEFVNFYVQK